MQFTVKEIAAATGGTIAQGSPETVCSGVSTDSRGIRPSEVFFALHGERFDGHVYIKDVIAKGAAAAVVNKFRLAHDVYPPPFEKGGGGGGFALIEVRDTLTAYGSLAAFVRNIYATPLLAISGSAGKTTTKEMAAAILATTRRVLKTEGNLNNLIGLPRTLLGLTREDAVAVVELGISEMGEMERLVEIARPDVAVITNIGRAHLATLGSIEGVATAKGPLFTNLRPDAVKVVNLDDEWVTRLAGDKGNRVTYSMTRPADVRVKEYSVDAQAGSIRVVYDVRGKDVEALLKTPSEAAVINGAAAIAATLPFDVSARDIRAGLESFTQISGRMNVTRAAGVTILDDTYNANPASMASALRTLNERAGRKVAVLGEMLELGSAACVEHHDIGVFAGELGIDVVVAVGRMAGDVLEGARQAGLDAARLHEYKDKKEAMAGLRFVVREGDTVLVKGSRGAALEEIVEWIKGRNSGAMRKEVIPGKV